MQILQIMQITCGKFFNAKTHLHTADFSKQKQINLLREVWTCASSNQLADSFFAHFRYAGFSTKSLRGKG